MAAASIKIDQANLSPTPGGQARRDIVKGVPVILRNADDTGVTSWRWSLLYKPPGSTAVMQNPFSAVANFTPDVAGHSYRVELAINQGRLGSGEVQKLVFRVPDAGGFAVPAVAERSPESNYIVGGVQNKLGFADEFVRRFLHTFDNRDDPYDFDLALAATENISLPWILKDAWMQRIRIRTNNSADATLSVYADAGHTRLIDSYANFDATGTGLTIATPKIWTDDLQLDGTAIYLSLRNFDVLSNFTMSLRVRPL